MRRKGDGGEGNRAKRERDEEEVAFVEKKPRICPYC